MLHGAGALQKIFVSQRSRWLSEDDRARIPLNGFESTVFTKRSVSASNSTIERLVAACR